MDEGYNIEQNKKRKKTQYWIDRSGKIHRFKGDMKQEYVSFHNEIAMYFYPNSNRPGDILMELGWIMVGSTVYSSPLIHSQPSQAQINTLHDLDLYTRLLYLHNNLYVNYAKNQALFTH